jgi:hypothetical protein
VTKHPVPIRQRPDLTRITDGIRGPIGAIAIASTGLFLLAAFYTLYFGREFFLPIAVAVLLNFLLTPAVRALKRLGIAAPIGAGVMLVLFFGAVGYGTYTVWTPAMEWVERAPRTLANAEVKLRSIREPVERLREAGEQVEALARGESADAGDRGFGRRWSGPGRGLPPAGARIRRRRDGGRIPSLLPAGHGRPVPAKTRRCPPPNVTSGGRP